MTEIISIANGTDDGIYSEQTMLWLIEDPPSGWQTGRVVCSILRSRRCIVTPKILAALARQPWHTKAVEAICVGTLKRKS